MTLKIAGMRYEVATDTKLEDSGTIHHGELLIRVDCELALDQINETILHEVMHGLENAYGFELPEQTIGQIARGMFAFMRDNPKFIRELL